MRLFLNTIVIFSYLFKIAELSELNMDTALNLGPNGKMLFFLLFRQFVEVLANSMF